MTSQNNNRESGPPSLSFDDNLSATSFDILAELCFQRQFGGAYSTWLKQSQEDENTFRRQQSEKESEIKSKLKVESGPLEANLREAIVSRILEFYPYGYSSMSLHLATDVHRNPEHSIAGVSILLLRILPRRRRRLLPVMVWVCYFPSSDGK